MLEGEKYADFLGRKDVTCCGRIPMSLPHIPITVKKRKGYDSHDSHYYNFAFECLECGAVYEIIIQDYSYESIGDFMQPNYTSWSTRPALRYIENHHIKDLKLIKDEYLKQRDVLNKLTWKQEEKLDRKISKLERITGRLDKEQVYNTKKNVGQIEIKVITGYKKQKENLKKTYIENVRNMLALPPISEKYKKDRSNKYWEEKKLEESLETYQKQLSSTVELISRIDSKSKLLTKIATIKKEIKALNNLP